MKNSSKEHFAHAVNIALEAIKSLLLVNGGAATALIALTNKTENGMDYSTSVLFFGCAALLNCFTMIIGYFSQLSYANSIFLSEIGETVGASEHHRWHGHLQKAAIGILCLSLVCSSIGMAYAFEIT